jgi:hypothetical protein
VATLLLLNPPGRVVAAQSSSIRVTPASKPWHVTEITASAARCDSPNSYTFQVSWKPVFNTWSREPGRGPSVWKHYIVGTKNKCSVSQIMCGDEVCTVVASGCSIRYPYSLMRIQTFLDESERGRGSFMQIGGIARPPVAFTGRTMECRG